MLRSTASKVMWVGRATVFVVGLAVILALVFGAATTAMGATGGNFILGKANAANKASKLTASIAAPALTLVNQSTAAAATALNISVASGKAPLKVNASAGTATNLSADKLDGKNSSEFLGKTETAADADKLDGRDSNEFATDGELNAKTADVWGYVRANGELVPSPSANIIEVTHPATGEYCVVTSIDYGTYLAPQVTLAEPGSTKIASVGTGYGSSCNPLYSATQTPIPVYIRTPSGAASDAEFSVFVPAPN